MSLGLMSMTRCHFTALAKRNYVIQVHFFQQLFVYLTVLFIVHMTIDPLQERLNNLLFCTEKHNE